MASRPDVQKLLTPFREMEAPEGAVCIVGDPEAQRLVAAWSSLPVRWRAPKGKVPTNGARSLWDWLWQGAHFDLDELRERARVGYSDVESRMPMLVGNRLIYPDGTVSKYAAGVLSSAVSESYGKRGQRDAEILRRLRALEQAEARRAPGGAR